MILKTKRGVEYEIDDVDLDTVLKHPWEYCSSGSKSYLKTASKYLHRILVNPPKGYWVDHIDGDTLNNKRSNLRICTPHQNCMNRLGVNTKSGFRGVYQYKNRWIATICFHRKQRKLGGYDSAKEAAQAYDKAAKEFFGEYAVLNFKEGDE